MLFSILGAAALLPVELVRHAATHSSPHFAILPAVAFGIAAGAKGLYDLGVAAHQKHLSNKIKKQNKRPNYQEYVDPNYKNNVALASYMASNARLPGEAAARNRMSSGVSRGVGNLVDTQQDPVAIAAGVAALDANYNKGVTDLTTQGAQFQQGNQRTLMQQRGILGQVQSAEKQKSWDWNQKQKYLGAMAATSALTNAAGQNANTGVGGLLQAGAGLWAGGAFGGKANPGTSGMPAPWNAASGGELLAQNFVNGFPTAQGIGNPNSLITNSEAQYNVNSSPQNEARRQQLIAQFGGVENIPAQYSFLFQ
jgi:hypothetical protein